MSCRTARTTREVSRRRYRWLGHVIAVLPMLTTTEAVADEIRPHRPALDLRHWEPKPRQAASPAPCYLPADCVIADPRLTDIPARTLVGGPLTSPVLRMAREFKQEGLPLAVLWQTPRNRIAFGINSHGAPGLWYVQRQN